MNNEHLFSVTIKQGENDSSGYESFEVNFVGSSPDPDKVPTVKSAVRLVPVDNRMVFICIDSLEFEHVEGPECVEMALMVPDGFVKLWGVHQPNIAVFEREIAKTIPYMWDVTSELPIPTGGRVAVSSYIEEANRNLLTKGYRFQLAPKEPQSKVEEAVAEVAEAIGTLPEDTTGELITPIEGNNLKKMKIGFDGKQILIVGNSLPALGQAVVVDYRHKQNGEKFEIVAADTVQVIGMEFADGLALAYGALSLTSRFAPELPLEFGLTKGAMETLGENIPELEDQTKWNSHLNMFVLNSEYVREEIARVATLGYVADLEE